VAPGVIACGGAEGCACGALVALGSLGAAVAVPLEALALRS
jgi:hypothetical protein